MKGNDLERTTGKVKTVKGACPSPVFINASVALSALGQGIEKLTSLENAEQLTRLPEPLNCYYQAIPLAPLEESYQRIYQLLSDAVEQVIVQQSLTCEQLAQTSLFLGSSSMDIGAVTSDAERAIWLSKLDRLNLYLIKKYGLSAVNFTFSTACTSSSNALIYATRLVRGGQVKQALVVGCEFYNQLTLKGFSSLELLSDQGLFPFSPKRDGMVLGEGVAALLLSQQRSDNSCLAMMDGYSSCDSYSLTTTEEDGSKIGEVIEKSLQLSGLMAQDIQLIKAHGTASVASDIAEANAINRIFARQVPSLVLKPFIGHTLGACGVLEVALLVDLIQQDIMPVPAYMQKSPSEVTLQNGVKELNDSLLTFVSSKKSFKAVNQILANHCGFGGNNAAFILSNLMSDDAQISTGNPTECLTTPELESGQGRLSVIAQSSMQFELTVSSKELRKQVKKVTGFEVRRMDAFTLIALQALYKLFEQEQALALNDCQLGLYGVGDYFSIELLQSLVLSIEEGDDVRPLDFISSVGNSANFYLAKQFNIGDVNLFTGASHNAIERIHTLAENDLALGIVDYSVVVHWQQNEHTRQCDVSLLGLK